MVLKNLQIRYTNCTRCGSSSHISFYRPETITSLEALHKAAYKACAGCRNKLGIREIKIGVVKMR